MINKNSKSSIGLPEFNPEFPASFTSLAASVKRRRRPHNHSRPPHLSVGMSRQAELLSDEFSKRATDLSALRAQGVQLSLLHPEDEEGLFETIIKQQNVLLQRFAHELLFERLIDRRVVLAALQLFYDSSSIFHVHKDWVRDECTMLDNCCRVHAPQTRHDTTLGSLFNQDI